MHKYDEEGLCMTIGVSYWNGRGEFNNSEDTMKSYLQDMIKEHQIDNILVDNYFASNALTIRLVIGRQIA